jgi:hypothetical protein
MKAKVWVLCTVLTDENAPAMPAVLADETEARAKYDEMIRAEWDSCMDRSDDGPYPSDPDDAQDRIRQAHGAEWDCQSASKFDPRLECAPDGGQFQAAVLTGCWAWRSSYCAGLR